jgi:predicted permease
VVQLLGRLHRGVSVAEAEQKLANLYRVAMPGPTGGADLQSTLQDASRGISGAREALERPLRLGLTLVAVLVLVACMNTGGLLLSRFVSRQGEFGIRVAIGAGRARLARQLLVEALVIAAAAAAIALFAGWLGAPLFMRIVPETGSQVAFDLRFDLRLVLFTISLAVLCAAGAAAASLFRLWRSDPAALLSTEGRTVITGSRRVTRTLIAAQVACSLLLVVGAVSMARTLVNLHRVPLGFDPEQMFVINVNAAGLAAPSEMSAYHARLSERIAAAPGVARATMAQIGVLTSSATIGTVTVAGFTPGSDDDRISRMFFVGRDYFGTMGMRIIAGRDFDARDEGPRSTVTVVNEQFANFYFGSPQNAVDRFVNKDVRVVGVVINAHYNTPRDQPSRAMFLRHLPMNRPSMAHIVRIGGDPSATMRAVTEAIVAHDSRLRPRAASVTELLATSLARERFFAVVAWLLSSLALVLACGGLYAAVAYAVLQRQGEIAVRIALGASAADVLSLVLRDPLTTTALGIAAGIPGAYLLMRSASSLLFGVSTFDVTTVALCGVALVLCGLLAAIWPARRAVSIDPVIALRNS